MRKNTDTSSSVYAQINKLKGNYFILNTIDKKLKKSFQYGLKNFFYSKNPLIGDVLHSYGEITVYKSTERNGVGFYKGLKRIDIKDIPVIISIDRAYAGLEKRVRIDRDRQQFDAKLQTTFYSIFARSGFYYREMENNPAIKYILEKSRPIWKDGSPLLNALASRSYHLRDDKSILKLFGKKYCLSVIINSLLANESKNLFLIFIYESTLIELVSTMIGILLY